MACAIGSRVQLYGLEARPDLNGKIGVCASYASESGRWNVRLDDAMEMALKETNLSLVRQPFHVVADSATMQGLRDAQEDKHVKIPDLTKAARALKLSVDHLPQPCAFFAVYDGHCGSQCSDFAAKGMHMKILRKLSADRSTTGWTESRIEAALVESCEELDKEFLSKFRTAKDGSTVVVALLVGQRCFVAWAGDSRCILAEEAPNGSVVGSALSVDHRPSNESEAARIVSVGGEVVALGDGIFRVAQGGYSERCLEITRAEQRGLGCIGKPPVAMAVSRSLGDREFKTVTRGADIIAATPEVRCLHLKPSHKFIALMSDGITDCMTDQEIVTELDRRDEPKLACTELLQEALSRGAGDNITTILVRFDWLEDVDGDAGGDLKRRRFDSKVCVICGGSVSSEGQCRECGVVMG